MSDSARLYEAILTGDAKAAEEVTKAALEAGADPQELLNKYMIPAMDEAGRRFERYDYFINEVLIAARAMKTAMERLAPQLAQVGAKAAGQVVIGTVQGDVHDIGKNLVASMLEGGGFEVTDLANVPAEQFVDEAHGKDGVIVALSALLTTTMPQMKAVIEALEAAGIRQETKVIIGGALITQRYADEIGADGYSDNANAAVGLVRKLVD